MKRTIKITAFLLIVVLTFSGCSLATVADPNLQQLKIKQEGGAAYVKSYTDRTTVTEVVIPDEYEGVPVTKIENFSLNNAESVKKITIGKNVREIGDWAMTNNQHLEAFEVSPENAYFTAVDGVLFTADGKTLVYYPPARNIAFDRYGTALNTTEYAIPDGVETIRSKAFYKCYYVDITYFPDSVTRIEEKAFHRASSLTDFTMPANIEYIGKDAFAYDDLLTEISIPATIKEIGDYAFFSCTAMEKIDVAAREADVNLGSRWQPTDKGRIKKSCVITFGE